MRKLIAFILTAVTLQVQAAAPSQESIEQLFVLTKTEATLESVYSNMEKVMRNMMAQSTQGKSLTQAQQQLADNFPAKIIAMMREEMGWEKMKPQYMQLYRDTFNQDEVNGLIDFYKSPTGQAYANKMPELTQRSMALSQQMTQSLMPKIIAAVNQSMAQTANTK
jgi:uncharacterized protein